MQCINCDASRKCSASFSRDDFGVRYEVAATKMHAESLKATFVVLILSDVLGGAVAVDSMLTRGGQRLAAKAEAERATLYTDSGGKAWPPSTNAEDSSGTVTADRLLSFWQCENSL